MGENGYAKDVLVTTDWLAEHAGDDNLVVAEVDENPDLYDEGHIAGVTISRTTSSAT
jgi:thiosulfate/3-mercaptopyruvate sulfurtransferase